MCEWRAEAEIVIKSAFRGRRGNNDAHKVNTASADWWWRRATLPSECNVPKNFSLLPFDKSLDCRQRQSPHSHISVAIVETHTGLQFVYKCVILLLARTHRRRCRRTPIIVQIAASATQKQKRNKKWKKEIGPTHFVRINSIFFVDTFNSFRWKLDFDFVLFHNFVIQTCRKTIIRWLKPT